MIGTIAGLRWWSQTMMRHVLAAILVGAGVQLVIFLAPIPFSGRMLLRRSRSDWKGQLHAVLGDENFCASSLVSPARRALVSIGCS